MTVHFKKELPEEFIYVNPMDTKPPESILYNEIYNAINQLKDALIEVRKVINDSPFLCNK